MTALPTEVKHHVTEKGRICLLLMKSAGVNLETASRAHDALTERYSMTKLQRKHRR